MVNKVFGVRLSEKEWKALERLVNGFEGQNLSEKFRAFLRSLEGVNESKLGLTTVNKSKAEPSPNPSPKNGEGAVNDHIDPSIKGILERAKRLKARLEALTLKP